jgi:toxin ParE1/3/4
MPNLTLAPLAREDIKALGRYTQKTWGVVQRDRYLNQLAQMLDRLLANQHPTRDRSDLRPGLLSCSFQRHLIFFRRDPAGNVAVLRVLHERMDIDRHV